METQTPESTLIQLNRRYSKIITSYLTRNNYRFTVSDSNSDGKVRIKIENLNPEAAFYLGVNTQVQLIDGEILI
jgi:hypothetical protein